MEAGKRTIRDIFNRGRNLEIPFFQRAYVWEAKQWQRFLEDMRMVTVTKKPYFLGSVILKQQEVASNKDAVLTVIDGQQRLTTLNIFMKVLALKTDNDAEFTNTFKKQRDKQKILLHNHNDEDSFNIILSLKSSEEIGFESDKILEAYTFFDTQITDNDIQGGLNFFDILDNVLFVGIDLNHEEDEQQIFDTINSLGVRLTTAELLKNYFFNRDEVGQYNEFWKSIFEANDEIKGYWDREITAGRLKRTFIDLFFYSFLQIKIQERQLTVSTKDKLEYSKVDSLFESYKDFINNYNLDKQKLLEEIKEYATLFKNNFDNTIIERELTSEYGIDRINAVTFGLETSTLIPYVLYVLKKNPQTESVNGLFQVIESYIMRRMVVKATSKNYNQLFTDSLISNEITTKESFLEFIEKNSDKVNYLPNDEELKQGFLESKLINKQAAGIIYLLESKIRDGSKQSTQLLGLSKYSLEHLMPKKWENNWGALNSLEEQDNRNKKLLTLGNLAIITQSLNASIRDADWKKKVEGRANKSGLKHFSGGIETLAPYLELESWDEEKIEERAKALAEQALAIWSINEQR